MQIRRGEGELGTIWQADNRDGTNERWPKSVEALLRRPLRGMPASTRAAQPALIAQANS